MDKKQNKKKSPFDFEPVPFEEAKRREEEKKKSGRKIIGDRTQKKKNGAK